MEEIKIKLFEEELKALNEGKEVSIFESEERDIKIIISYSKD